MSKTGIARDREIILNARGKGKVATLGAFARLSGPGWLQSAITLGGGSLASSLYLGVLAGASLLWLQPLAMVLGVIMLSAISYVTLSTQQRPFQAIRDHVNPVLAWGWAIAVMMANLVWSLPQFSLGVASVRQNLLPGLVGAGVMPDWLGKLIVCSVIVIICSVVVLSYDRGSRGVHRFEILLKCVVALIVLAFFGVVLKMSFTDGGLAWGEIFKGFIPQLSLLSSPADTFTPFINDVAPQFQDFWKDKIVGQQRDVMISAAATAVGINMTFLLPYSMLKRGWDKDFRGMAIFDLATGLFIPFILVTSCVVIASAAQFHTRYAEGLVSAATAEGISVEAPPQQVGRFNKIVTARIKNEMGAEAFNALSAEEKAGRVENLPAADKIMAATLIKRDAFDLADSLAPLTGDIFAQYVFGLGVVGMAISTIIILMLINGFVFCEMIRVPSRGTPYRIGSMMALVGVLGPFIWTGGKAQFWLAVPTSVFGMALLPIAYFTFYMLMNQKTLLGSNMPRGVKRLVWNLLMAVATTMAFLGSLWSLWSKQHWKGVGVFVVFGVLVVIGHFYRTSHPVAVKDTEELMDEDLVETKS